MAIVTDLSVNNQWNLRQGDDNSFTITFVDSVPAAFDTSNYVFTMRITAFNSKATPIITLTEGAGITNGGATGILTFTLTAAQTASFVNSYYYEIDCVFPDTTNHVLFQGKAVISEYEYTGAVSTALTATVNLSGSNVTATITLSGSQNSAASQAAVNTGTNSTDFITPSTLKGISVQTFTLADELTFDDYRGKKSLIQQAGTRSFTLAASGNLDGAVIEARINEPASEPTFSSDFNLISGGDVYDNTKLLSILFRYDAERSKVDYFYKNLPAVDTISPTISTAIVGNSDKDGLVITFIEDVNITDLTGLSLSFSVGTPKTIISVAGTGTSILTFTLSADIDPSDEFDLVIGAANNIEDNAGNGLVAVTQSVTNNVTNTFDVSTISPEHIHLPMDIAGTNADPATSITDSLASTPYNFDNVAGIPRAIQNSKECLNFTSTIIRTVSTSLSTLFQNSFSASLQIKLTDGNPTSTKYFMHIANAVISRFIVDLRTDGKITVTYTSNSVSVFAQTAAAVFADGAMSDFSQIVVKVPSGGTIDILLDGISQTLSGSFDGDMSGVNMALFNSSTEKLRIGANTDGAGFGGWGRQFTLQPVIYSAGNITDLDSL
jgi:hypothetical protein